MKLLSILILGGLLMAAEPAPPKISTEDKLAIRELQVKLLSALRASEDASRALQTAQGALMTKVKSVQPEGWQMSEDKDGGLILIPTPKPETPKKEEKKK